MQRWRRKGGGEATIVGLGPGEEWAMRRMHRCPPTMEAGTGKGEGPLEPVKEGRRRGDREGVKKTKGSRVTGEEDEAATARGEGRGGLAMLR